MYTGLSWQKVGIKLYNKELRGGRHLAQFIDNCTLCTLACPSKRLEFNCTTRKVNNMGQLPQISQWQGFAQVIDHCTLCTLSCPSKRLKLNCTTRKVNDMGQLPQILVRYDIRIGTIRYTNRYDTIYESVRYDMIYPIYLLKV